MKDLTENSALPEEVEAVKTETALPPEDEVTATQEVEVTKTQEVEVTATQAEGETKDEVSQEEAKEASASEQPTEEKEKSDGDGTFSFESLKRPIKPVWKVLFAALILACIGVSLYFSFTAVSLDKYEFTEEDGGWQLKGFHNDNKTEVLNIDYVYEQQDDSSWVANEAKPVISIREFALCCDECVKEIYIGETVTEIQDQAFYSCKNLQAIHVAENNPAYCSENGILYNKDKTELILFPIDYINYEGNTIKTSRLNDAGEEEFVMTYTLPESVKKTSAVSFAYANNLIEVTLPNVEEIGDMTFFKCTSMEKITLSDSTKVIGSDAFSYCKKLTNIFVPKTVQEIKHHAFWECQKLEYIDLGHTESEFKDVQTGDYWRNEDITDKIDINYGRSRE